MTTCEDLFGVISLQPNRQIHLNFFSLRLAPDRIVAFQILLGVKNVAKILESFINTSRLRKSAELTNCIHVSGFGLDFPCLSTSQVVHDMGPHFGYRDTRKSVCVLKTQRIWRAGLISPLNSNRQTFANHKRDTEGGALRRLQ